MADRQRPERRGRARPSRRKRRLAVAACAVVACGAVIFALLASRGRKEPLRTLDPKDIEIYKVDTLSEYPFSLELVYLVPYDAAPHELYTHMQLVVELLRTEVPDLFSVSIDYYDAPFLYEADRTPVAECAWGPPRSSWIQPGDYSQHRFYFQPYPYDADYALTAEEWDLYQEILEYFLYEKGCPPYYIDPEDPYRHPDRVEEYRRLAERLGCSYETLMVLPHKVLCWRPRTIESLTEDGD